MDTISEAPINDLAARTIINDSGYVTFVIFLPKAAIFSAGFKITTMPPLVDGGGSGSSISGNGGGSVNNGIDGGNSGGDVDSSVGSGGGGGTMSTDLNHPSWSPVNLVPVAAMVMVLGLVVLFGSEDNLATAAAALSSKHPSPDAVVSMAATDQVCASIEDEDVGAAVLNQVCVSMEEEHVGAAIWDQLRISVKKDIGNTNKHRVTTSSENNNIGGAVREHSYASIETEKISLDTTGG
ncbi:hypothetical protein FHL15_002317 [Xylaria flabelliformis]|uniref:Uncharacterized protein n=1 Tax=Xylaria flabelliformis TaxID=2512241 RepID=A0A553I9Y9_9PEZI|nr:hypothetical protein FHL15_002317 [Xylaria flabelliformis]